MFRDDELVQNYVLDISGAKNMTSDEKYAVLSSVKLKDGTMLTDIVESGDENTNTAGEYELLFTTDRMLDVSQVESLLFWKNAGEDAHPELQAVSLSQRIFLRI